MNIDSLFVPSKCCLTSLSDDIFACLSILRHCWQTEEVLTTLNETQALFNASLEMHCSGVCENCRNTLLEIFKRLDAVGLDGSFFNLLKARQNLKKLLKKQTPKKRSRKPKNSTTANNKPQKALQ